MEMIKLDLLGNMNNHRKSMIVYWNVTKGKNESIR